MKIGAGPIGYAFWTIDRSRSARLSGHIHMLIAAAREIRESARLVARAVLAPAAVR